MSTRRQVLLASAICAVAPIVRAQPPRVVKVGILGPRPLNTSMVSGPLLRALAELGYRDGETMRLEYRSSDAQPKREPALARDLIERNCDLIFALGTEGAARAFRDARTAIPVVFLAVDYDPLEKGVVDNLSQPGGNLTGVYAPIAALTAKKLELALDVLPAAKRVFVVSDAGSKDQLDALKRAVDKRSVDLLIVEFGEPPYDINAAFRTARSAKVEAFIGLSSPGLASHRAAMGDLFLRNKIPAFVGRMSMGEPGYLAAYTTDFGKVARRTAQIGARILKGAKPGNIPVEQADEFELVVNMKTAKTLGLKMPYSVLARATRMVE